MCPHEAGYIIFASMENISSAFRKRYLDTHEKYLDSISTLLRACSDNEPLGPGQFLLARTNELKAVCTQLRSRNTFDEKRALTNLRNSWYHECAFNYPDDMYERLKFAPWRLIQFFYVIYTGLSAIVRCFDNRPRLKQNAALNAFTDEMIIKPPTRLLPVPLCFYLQGGVINPAPRTLISWSYGLSCHVPNIERCLLSVPKQSTPVSLFHYFKSLREWANYEDSHIFINLYGPRVIEMLDASLKTIVSTFCTVIELFLICFYGWDKVNDQFNQFQFRLPGTLKIYPYSLATRFGEYSKYSGLTV